MKPLTVAIMGDIYASPRTFAQWEANQRCFDAIRRHLDAADLRFANLESPIIEGGTALFSTGVRLRTSPAVINLLRSMPIDVVGIANNHMNDFGPEGILSTL